MKQVLLTIPFITLSMLTVDAMAQSSSLFVQESDEARRPQRQQQQADDVTARGRNRAPHELSPAIASVSYSAVNVPEPRQFARHDLITIIIRESTESDFEASLNTEKGTSFEGEISDFPQLSVKDLLNLELKPSTMDDGNPAVGIDFSNEFEGDGEYSRSESVTGRITAEIIDIKPNGNLVLEATKHLRTDEETLDIVLTGMCRPEDISVDNTILSTQMHNLHLDKQHEGELNDSTEKGLLTKLFEALFNF